MLVFRKYCLDFIPGSFINFIDLLWSESWIRNSSYIRLNNWITSIYKLSLTISICYQSAFHTLEIRSNPRNKENEHRKPEKKPTVKSCSIPPSLDCSCCTKFFMSHLIILGIKLVEGLYSLIDNFFCKPPLCLNNNWAGKDSCQECHEVCCIWREWKMLNQCWDEIIRASTSYNYESCSISPMKFSVY